MTKYVTPESLIATNNAVEVFARQVGQDGRDARTLIGPIARVGTMAEVATTPFPAGTTSVQALGYYNENDGAGPVFSNPVAVNPNKSDAVAVQIGSPPVQRWLRQVHEGAGVDLVRHGLYGDAATNLSRDDTARFLDAIALAADLGRYKIEGQGGRQFRVAQGLVPVDFDLDLKGGTLMAAKLNGEAGSANGSVQILRSELASPRTIAIRNGTIEGGFLGASNSLYGQRALHLIGGRVTLQRLNIVGLGNKAANTYVSGLIDIFDPTQFRQGNIVLQDCDEVDIDQVRFFGNTGEDLIVMSGDGRTICHVDRMYGTKRRRDNPTLIGSNSAINFFNLNRASSLRRSVFKGFANSAVNALTNGMLIESVHVDTVTSSVGIDINESSHVAMNTFRISNCHVRGCSDYGIRSSASNLIIENCDVGDTGPTPTDPGAGAGIQIEPNTAGNLWAGTWFPAMGYRYISSVKIDNLRVWNNTIADVRISSAGSASTDRTRVEINSITHQADRGARSPYGVIASRCNLVLRGNIDAGGGPAGAGAMVQLSSGGGVRFDRATIDVRTNLGDVVALDNVSTNARIEHLDTIRVGTMQSGKLDIALAGSTTTAVVTAIRKNSSTVNSYPADLGREVEGVWVRTVADDDIWTIATPNLPRLSGVMFVTAYAGEIAVAETTAELLYAAISTPRVSAYHTGTLVAIGTTALTAGTGDGVDGSINVAVLNGSIIIKNRNNGSRTIRVSFPH